MKTQRIIYWITTSVFSLWMLKNVAGYLFAEEAKQLCAHFSFPDYFRVELGIAKLIGSLVLLAPLKQYVLKEWAYAGFGITMVSGFIAHVASGDPFPEAMSALLALHLLVISYITGHRLRAFPNSSLPTF